MMDPTIGHRLCRQIKNAMYIANAKGKYSSTQYSLERNLRDNVSISGWIVTECVKQSGSGLPGWEKMLPTVT